MPETDGLRISGVSAGDAPAIHRIEAVCFPETPWPVASLATEADHARSRFYMAHTDQGDLPVGYILSHFVADEMHLLRIAVEPTYRKLGIGRSLLRATFEQAASEGVSVACLEVRPSNRAAIQLYKNFGYIPVGRRCGYFSADGEDALIFKSTRLQGGEQ